jgi:copper chaperone
MQTTVKVSGMTCGHCVSAVTMELSLVPNVTAVDVDLAAGQVTITSVSYTHLTLPTKLL